MRKNILISVILFLILLIGFIFAQFIQPVTFCTEKLCYPDEPYAEIACNSCEISQPIFVTGIINIVKFCQGNDILVFENSLHISDKDRVEIDYNSCEYKIKFFLF